MHNFTIWQICPILSKQKQLKNAQFDKLQIKAAQKCTISQIWSKQKQLKNAQFDKLPNFKQIQTVQN